ncbi:hypothetical protein HAX54_038523 [Datura stramonium]|uniref:Ferrochelatase n=1 Tax=Datura stramonium TaxID=4076 RepID=A0ABS8VMQ8_DATST|nr:hypothetical protein [Datura stramonium]
MAPPMIFCREISPSPSNCTSYSPFLQVDTQCSLPSSSFAASCLRVPKNCSLVARCSLKWSDKSSVMPGALVTSRSQEVSTNPVIGEGKIGVLLLNLGGPETLEDVQPFLFNLFADPDIIRLPRLFRFLQRPLAQFISVARAPKSKEGYASIGGGSPLRRITDAQAEALRKALWEKNVPAKVYVGMRYWHPFTEEAIEQPEVDIKGTLSFLDAQAASLPPRVSLVKVVLPAMLRSIVVAKSIVEVCPVLMMVLQFLVLALAKSVRNQAQESGIHVGIHFMASKNFLAEIDDIALDYVPGGFKDVLSFPSENIVLTGSVLPPLIGVLERSIGESNQGRKGDCTA